ncbi:MAG: fused MFS/spermidine synthase, partial [Actinomycetota bacterium]
MSWLSGAALFLVSAAALVVEIVAGRMLAPYVGMSLYTWTAIIAVVLAGLSAGNWIGGRLAEAAAARARVGIALLLAAAACAATPLLVRALSGPLLALGWNPIAAIVTLTAALFLAPSLLAGVASPVLTKLAVDAAPAHAGRAIGRMYALGAAGSIVGALAAGFLFISWLGTVRTILAVSALYAVLGLVLLQRRRVAAVLVGLAAGAAAWAGDSLASPCRVESDYYCIRVDDFSRESGREAAVLVLDHLGHGINDRAEPRLLYSSYLQFADELAHRRFGAEDISAFFIGGGAFTLPRAWA